MTISVLQSRQSSASATNTAITLAFSSPLTAGSAIHVAGSNDSGSAHDISSFSDGTNTYSAVLDDVNDATNAQRMAQAHADNVASGTPTVSVNFSASSTFRGIWIKEIGGCSASPLDGHTGQLQSAPGTGTDAVTSGNATNTNQPALIASVTVNTTTNAASITQGTGFTVDSAGGNWNSIYGGNQVQAAGESKRITTSGVGVAATYTISTAAAMITLEMIFDEATAAFPVGQILL